MPPGLEIRVPISATRPFFTMLHYLAASLRVHAPQQADTKITVWVGSERRPQDLARELRWTQRYPIEWVWVPRRLYRERSYFATAAERLLRAPHAEVVLFLDPDTLVSGPIDEPARESHATQALLGLPAHVSPFLPHPERPPQDWWHAVFASAGLACPPSQIEHSGWEAMFTDPAYRYCPPYLNGGVLFVPAEAVPRLGASIYADMDAVAAVLPTDFRCQIALAVAMARGGLRWSPLPIRFNCPNDPAMWAKHAASLATVGVFHYMRRGEIDKLRDFDGVESVARMLGRPGSSEPNRRLVETLEPVHRQVVADLAV